MGKANDKIIFWASFLTLIAAGMAMSIRNDIIQNWGRDYGFTQTELGTIQGMGLMGFGLTIIFFSFFADVWGYGKLMVVAFLLHASAVLVTLAAPFAYGPQGNKAAAYWCLYIGQFLFSLGNGTCEAVINPLTATLFPKNRTHWLNILHAGWPGGLVLGSLAGVGFNMIPGGVGWTVRWGVVLAPVLLYGILMIGRSFPASEAKEHGVKTRDMMSQLGLFGAAVAAVLIGLWLSNDLIPGIQIGQVSLAGYGWLGWIVALVAWLVFGAATGFTLGHWMLAFLLIIHAMVGYVELGTDSWIVDIGKVVVTDANTALMGFVLTNVLMFTLRFFAGPIVHTISPIGLLFVSAVVGTIALLVLGMPVVKTTWLWLAAVSLYGIGKTFYWPTMLGVISERFPRGGALALGFSGGVGMLSAGILGSSCIGYEQDYAASHKLQQTAPATYERYKTDTPKAPLPFLPPIAGLDNAKVGVLLDYDQIQKTIKQREQDKLPPLPTADARIQLEKDLELLKKQGGEPEALKERLKWWDTQGLPHATQDYPAVEVARVDGGKTALTWTAAVPATMALCYLLLLLYFKLVGGYKAEVLVGHAAIDEEFTGGVEGPVE
jgi:MFS family permease